MCTLDTGRFTEVPNSEDLLGAGWASDGRAFFGYVRGAKAFEVFRVDLETGSRTLFRKIVPPDTTGLIGVGTLSVSPDGSAYAYGVVRTLSQLHVLQGLR